MRRMIYGGLMVGGLTVAASACNVGPEHMVDPLPVEIDAAVPDAIDPLTFYVNQSAAMGRVTNRDCLTPETACGNLDEAMMKIYPGFVNRIVLLSIPSLPTGARHQYHVEIDTEALTRDMGACR